MKREEARRDINSRPLTDFVSLEMSRKAGRDMYVCPICGSGNRKNKTGALRLFREKNRVQCFSSGCFTDKGEDTLGALRIIWNCGETEALERAGYSLDKEAPAPEHQEHKKNTEHQEYKPEADYTSFYRQCHQALKESPEALEYLHGRGITDASIDRFLLGYCPAWKHSRAGEKVKPTRRIIIPRTARTYNARNIDKPRNEWEEEYIKQIEGRQKDLFNLEALDGAETPIICEGELDAISLYQAGAASVVAIGTTTNAGTLLAEAKKHPAAVFILALDNDLDKEDGSNPGKEAQKKLAEDMKAAGLEVLSIDPAKIYGEAKDGNEAITKDPERLGNVVAYLQEKAREMKTEGDEEREAEPLPGIVTLESATAILESVDDTFMNIKSFTNLSGILRIRTHDTIVIAGDTGAGKSSLALNFLYGLQDRFPALYVNLEMDAATVLQRLIAIHTGIALDEIEGYQRDSNTRSRVNAALKEITGRKELQLLNDVYSIKDIERQIQTATQGREAPTIVFVDTGLLVQTPGRSASRYERFTEISEELRRISRLYNIVLFVLLQQSRAGKEEKQPTNSSLKESGSWENDATKVLFLWQNPAKKKEIVITKNRNGRTGSIALDYAANIQRYREAMAGQFTEIIDDADPLPEGWDTMQERSSRKSRR